MKQFVQVLNLKIVIACKCISLASALLHYEANPRKVVLTDQVLTHSILVESSTVGQVHLSL